MSSGSFQCRRQGLVHERLRGGFRFSFFLFLPLTDGRDCILEPLSLPESPGGPTASEGPPSAPCIFCEEHFPVAEQDKLLKHMIIEHKIVIADVKLVADFRR